MWADAGYDGAPLARWAKTIAAITVEVVKRTSPHSFQVVRRRWVIERTFGWLMRAIPLRMRQNRASESLGPDAMLPGPRPVYMGNPRRWSLTYEEFAAARLLPLLRYATMLTGDAHLAGDLVQEVMVKVQLRWRRVAATAVPELYVRRMVTNTYMDWRRTAWWRLNVLRERPEDAVKVGVSADHAVQSADRDQLWILLRSLSHRQRAALVLRFYEDLSDAEVAEVLDCAVGTVRSLISRGLATLRSAMAADLRHEAMEARKW